MPSARIIHLIMAVSGRRALTWCGSAGGPGGQTTDYQKATCGACRRRSLKGNAS